MLVRREGYSFQEPNDTSPGGADPPGDALHSRSLSGYGVVVTALVAHAEQPEELQARTW